jgi:hypothetical protein
MLPTGGAGADPRAPLSLGLRAIRCALVAVNWAKSSSTYLEIVGAGERA